MPIPKPKKNEPETKFIERCMSNDTMKKEFKDNKQRLAVCYDSWRKSKNKKREDGKMTKKDQDTLRKILSDEDQAKTSKFEMRMHEGPELRAERDGDKIKLVGTPIVFNELSLDLGGFREKVSPGATKKSLRKSDVRALWNHDRNFVLGRKSARTLKLKEDAEGLQCEIIPDMNISWHRDLVASIERGDITQMSFGFRTVSDSWEKKGKENIRTLEEIEILDVSAVTWPAYPQTSITARSVLQRVGVDYESVERALIRLEYDLDLDDEDRGAIAKTVEALNELIPEDATVDQRQKMKQYPILKARPPKRMRRKPRCRCTR